MNKLTKSSCPLLGTYCRLMQMMGALWIGPDLGKVNLHENVTGTRLQLADNF